MSHQDYKGKPFDGTGSIYSSHYPDGRHATNFLKSGYLVWDSTVQGTRTTGKPKMSKKGRRLLRRLLKENN